MALLEEKGISREQFAELHPGGVWAGGCYSGFDVPRGGFCALTPLCGRRSSVWRTTAGWPWCRTMDISRVSSPRGTSPASRSGSEVFERRVDEVMTRTPRTTSPDDLAGAAVGLMQEGVSWCSRWWTPEAGSWGGSFARSDEGRSGVMDRTGKTRRMERLGFIASGARGIGRVCWLPSFRPARPVLRGSGVKPTTTVQAQIVPTRCSKVSRTT